MKQGSNEIIQIYSMGRRVGELCASVRLHPAMAAGRTFRRALPSVTRKTVPYCFGHSAQVLAAESATVELSVHQPCSLQQQLYRLPPGIATRFDLATCFNVLHLDCWPSSSPSRTHGGPSSSFGYTPDAIHLYLITFMVSCMIPPICLVLCPAESSRTRGCRHSFTPTP